MLPKSLKHRFEGVKTPFYYYDRELLDSILKEVIEESSKYGFRVHYAVKANANNEILKFISSAGLGADCVSGNEISRSVECGFKPSEIAFAGVGKSDKEIELALETGIFSFNVESYPELENIDAIARRKNLVAPVALRINPNVDASTHRYITTGIEESKFGINMWDLESCLDLLASSDCLELKGIHFHIGSQITTLTPFKALCSRINELQDWFNLRNIWPGHVNVGGGLGIDYHNPDNIPDFKAYFALFNEFLDTRKGQEVHFELGRAITGPVGSLITRVLYVKESSVNDIIITDAGMTDLIRPALYQAYHAIENLSSESHHTKKYTVSGPVCESADSFGKFIELPQTSRGDLLAIRSAGAYGRVMSSQYNLRDLPGEVF